VNVEKLFTAIRHYKCTDEVIRERNRLSVLFVEIDLQRLEALLFTTEFTLERNHTNAACVIRRFIRAL